MGLFLNVDNILEVLLLLVYPLEAVFLVFMSRKCFFDKFRIGKSILIFLVSPQTASFLAFLVSSMQYDRYDDSSNGMLHFSGVYTVLLLVLQIIFMFIYVNIVKAKTKSIAMFLYLCNAMLVPGIFLSFGVTFTILPLLSFVGLNLAFYLLVGKNIAELSKEELTTNPRMFVSLSLIVFAYKAIVFFGKLYVVSWCDMQISDYSISLVNNLRKTNPDAHILFKTIFSLETTSSHVFNMIVILSDIFILIVLIAAFSVITRNIKYTNEVIKARDEVKTLAVEMMEALAHTIDAKDKYTRGHSVRVANYSRMLAERMGLPAKDCEDVYYYGLLHDLGKIGVPNEIINSDSKLTDEEYQVIKKHPQIGYDILAEIQSRPDLTIGARWHHERYDGKGYPDGKKGDEIPLLARIIAVADSYDAMTSNRSYRNYLPQDVVREEIKKNAGIQFDPEIVRYMLELIDEDKEYKLHE